MKDHQLSRRLAATFPLTFLKLRPLREAARDGGAFSLHLPPATPPPTPNTKTPSSQSGREPSSNSGNYSFTVWTGWWGYWGGGSGREVGGRLDGQWSVNLWLFGWVGEGLGCWGCWGIWWSWGRGGPTLPPDYQPSKLFFLLYFFQRQLHDRNGCEETPLQGRPVTRWPHAALQRAHSAHRLFNGENKTTLSARFYLRKDPLGAAC